MTDSIFRLLLKQKDFKEGAHWARKIYDEFDSILIEGETSGKVFLILNGTARILGDIELDNEYHVRPGIKDLTTGEVFGELSLLDESPHSASVLALSRCEVAIIDSLALKDYLARNSELAAAFYQELGSILVQRLRKANLKVLSLLSWGLKAHGIERHLY